MTEEVLLAARGLVRNFGAHAALRGIDLTLARGEVLGFLGLNGAGKTTTMQILAGALAPHAGTITLRGEALHRGAHAALGYLPQTPPVIDDVTVDEYLALCAQVRGVAGAAVATACARARALCGLGDVGARLIRHLSQGYRQRVGLAQAIVHDPDVLLLDEPTTGLDPAQIRDVRALIAELGRARSVLISTHILPEVRALASRIAILHQGVIVHDQANASSARAIRLRLARSPAVDRLQAVAGVATLTALPDGSWLVEGNGQRDVREALATAVVDAGWGLLELHEDDDALERLFMQLTAGAQR